MWVFTDREVLRLLALTPRRAVQLRQLGLLAIVMLQPLPLVGAAVVPLLVGVLHAQSRRAVRVGVKSLAQATKDEAPALAATG